MDARKGGDAVNMLVSGISQRNGKKVAYVLFEDGERSAEAVIPECEILTNKGFSETELKQMKQYMQKNLDMIKNKAAGINPIHAMMKD